MINPKLAAKHRKMHGLPSPTSGSSKSASSAVSTSSVDAVTHHDHPDEQGFSGMDDRDLDYRPSDHMELSNDKQLPDSDRRPTHAEISDKKQLKCFYALEVVVVHSISYLIRYSRYTTICTWKWWLFIQ